MDEYIHWPKPYLLLSATCDEMLSWMINIWMKNYLVRDSNCNTANLHSPPPKKKQKTKQGMTNNVGLTFSVGDTIPRFTISIEQDN